MSYSQGKTSSSGTTTTSPVISGTQGQYIGNQAQLGTDVMQSLGGLLGGAANLYNTSAGGVNQAATNLAQTGNAISQNLGQGGAGAYQTGINALSNITSPDYQQQQIAASMIPAQLQYEQNIAAQNAGFGGAGQLGSARQALAGQALAGQTQLQEQQAAAQVQQQLANQKLAAAQGLTGAGTSGAQLGLTGAQAGITAAQSPMAYLQQLASLYGGIGAMPQAQPQFGGTTGMTTSTGQQGASTTGGVQI
jgi:hypothetical protein